MRIGHPSWLPVILASLPVGALPVPGPQPGAAVAAAVESEGISQARALDIARQAAALEGYDLTQYQVASVEQDPDGTWVVFFQHLPPVAPGQHCTVYVAPDGTARVMHGR